MDDEGGSSDEESAAAAEAHTTSLAAVAAAAAHTTSLAAKEEPSYRGVRKLPWGRYVAKIRDPDHKQRVWLGTYDTPVEAARAFDEAALRFYGKSARLNFPHETTEPAPEGSARFNFVPHETTALAPEGSATLNFPHETTAPAPKGSARLNFPHETTAPALPSEGAARADAGMTAAPRMTEGAALSTASIRTDAGMTASPRVPEGAASIRTDAIEVGSRGGALQTGATDAVTHPLHLQPGGNEKEHHHPQLFVGLGSQTTFQCASLGAMGSLLGKLHALLSPGWRQLPKMVRDGMQVLRDDLEEICAYLEDLSDGEDPPLTAKCWMKEVRELSYDIEDYIDKTVQPVCAKFKSRFVSKTRHIKITRLPKRLKRHQQIADMVSDFRIYVREAIERYESYELDCCTFRRRFVSVGPMTTPYKETDDLVIDSRMSDFITSLANDEDQQLKVVSVVGPGCLGKTTLAKMFYNKFGRRYDCAAFVWVSRKPDMKKIFRDMLWQVQRQQPPDDCKELDLVDNIRKHLQDRRYLLIIDDLWAASVWDIIIRAFPKGSQRSRIITTTQIQDVALSCCCYSSDYVFEMRPLDDYHSRKLFFGRLLGSDTYCPQQFEEVLSEIVGICGGLPLATISIANLLASQPVILMDLLMYTRDSLSSCLSANSTSEGMRQVLNLSYNNLPHYLKTCLLYLIIYPECRAIWKDDLVNQWVAEGFINTAEGQDMEEVAESYFYELIDRSFIQPMYVNYNNEVLSCTVHVMVRDLIAHKSAEENFILVTDYYRKNVALSDNVHRLSLHFGDAKYAKMPANIRKSQVRSLTFFGLSKCMPSITEFKLVRVLNLELSGHHGDVTLDLTRISELFQLRYLKVASARIVCVELPYHMRELQCLETMDVIAKLSAVPWDVIDLPRLLHLRLRVQTSLFDWIGTLRSDSLWSLGKLKDLRGFHLSCSTPPSDHLQRSMEALGSLLQGHGSLKTLSLVPGSFDKIDVARDSSEVIIVSWDGLVPPRLLERFEWLLRNCIFSGVPKWMGELSKLCILKIAVEALLTHDIDVLGGLPALTGLSLYVQAVPANKIVFGKAGFSVLRYFKFRCSVPWLKFEANAMPNLQKLKLGFDAPTVDQEHGIAPIVIEYLSGLEDISAKIGGAGVDAESALDISVCNDPRNPEVQFLGQSYDDETRGTMTRGQQHDSRRTR